LEEERIARIQEDSQLQEN